jgi:hypothetical protein
MTKTAKKATTAKAKQTAAKLQQEREAALEAIKRHERGQVPNAQGKGRSVERCALKPAKRDGELESFFWLQVELGLLKFNTPYTRKELRRALESTGRWSSKGTASNAPIDRLSQDLRGAAYCLVETVSPTPEAHGSNIFELNRVEYTRWAKETRPRLVALGMAK